MALAEDDGDVIERYWYEPYGSVTFADSAGVERTEDNALNKTLLFQGRRYDPETGFYYYRNRYYSPVLGRFLQRDPAGYQDGMNLYYLLMNAPLFNVDPLGLGEREDKLRDQAIKMESETVRRLEARLKDTVDEGTLADVNAELSASISHLRNLHKWQAQERAQAPFTEGLEEGAHLVTHHWSKGRLKTDREEIRNKSTLNQAADIAANISAKVGPIAIVVVVLDRLFPEDKPPEPGKVQGEEGSGKRDLPDEAWDKKAPKQVEPGTKRVEHRRYNPKTGKYEPSTVEYDEYGRQIRRTDSTDHGFPADHENPHTHRYEYNERYPFGREIK